MKVNRIFLLFLVISFLYITALQGVADANGKSKKRMPPVDNETYSGVCSSCHFLYLPGLLPGGSWVKIIDGAKNHFGNDIAFDEESLAEIRKYLKANGAESTRAKRSVKIMKSLKGATPLRITEVPYIIKKHDDIKSKVFKRESVGSLANCVACHRTAAKGIFDDDDVKIPKK